MEAQQNIEQGAFAVAGPGDPPFRLRSYQAEMVNESLKANIIVVMDTGSGKTHIAIERTRAELETCEPNKLVWFLAPTVPLCKQQYEVFKTNLPSYGIQILCGDDGVNHWTDQSVWDAVLCNVRIVLSTHQVLLDALTHAFVKMSKLALLIFDEAHHCTLKHSAHRIMSDFYETPTDAKASSMPKILGLSASPVMKAKATSQDLQQIEENLHATAKTPKIHRTELVRHIHKPELKQIGYRVASSQYMASPLLLALEHMSTHYDLMKDPYVVDLLRKKQNGHDVSKLFEKLFLSKKTYCNDQLRMLLSKAKAMTEELGISAMEWYVCQCISQYEKTVHDPNLQVSDFSIDEKQYLLELLRTLSFTNDALMSSLSLAQLSLKVTTLIDLLVSEAHNSKEFTGLVFVEQRVWVAALAEILTLHPRTKDLFRVGTFVGTSQSNKRKANIATFAEPRNQKTTLDDFRAGTTNLILATSVLEEGIDISSCHLVICFERPKNLKSFVQRRGRARKQRSKYFIFIPETEGVRSTQSWEALEADMRAAYEDDLRKVKKEEEREEESEEGDRVFQVSSTGARLTLDNASQHLHHFCGLLSSGAHVDPRPQFNFYETRSGRVSAEVTLPILVDPSVRIVRSRETWKTERVAKKDAAFEAYVALYHAGLVNDNLLPSRPESDEQMVRFDIPDHRPAMVEIFPLLDPWPAIARFQQDNPYVWHRILLTITTPTDDLIKVVLLTPLLLPLLQEIILYWNESKQYKVESSSLPGTTLTTQEVHVLRLITRRMLYSIFQGRMQEEKYDFLWLLAPCDSQGRPLEGTALSEWESSTKGHRELSRILAFGYSDVREVGLLSIQGDARKYFPSHLDSDNSTIVATRVPKRRDFLHHAIGGNGAHTKAEIFATSKCTVDNLPAWYSMFALLLPSILHRLEICMIADSLRSTLLKPISLRSSDLSLLIRALTSSSTDEEDNYQRLEFLGDCILKFIASVHLMANNLKDPESYLTAKKGKIVSNGFLARATLAIGLDKYVITKRFTGAKWAPRFVGDVLANTAPPQKVQRSSKLIADVIESLIGVSYVIGGFEKAFTCMQTLLPQAAWIPLPQANSKLHDSAPSQDTVTSLSILEVLIGHVFKKKGLLLEALTHASYIGANAHCSYERLEFLGDAVLDYIVSRRLYAYRPELSHRKMHGIRTAMVNAPFLTFKMFEATVPENITNKETKKPEVQQRALWQFLRYGGYQLTDTRDLALQQHEAAKEHINAALKHDARFPWQLLASTDPPKFLSDIVESVIGAVYVDTYGDIPTCENFMRRLGIIDCLEHILRDDVDCFHPKERLNVLAVNKGVKYVPIKGGHGDTSTKKGTYTCQVKIGGDDVGGRVEGLKKLNAEVIAAWKAVSILERSGDTSMNESEDGDEFFDADEGGVEVSEQW